MNNLYDLCSMGASFMRLGESGYSKDAAFSMIDNSECGDSEKYLAKMMFNGGQTKLNIIRSILEESK